MSRDLQGLQEGLSAAEVRDIPRMVYQAMQDSLRIVTQTATGKFMIQTGKSKRSDLPGVDVSVDSGRLTMRSGHLARSLTRQDHPQHIQLIRQDGTMVRGEVGSSVEYARIHEVGGQTAPHDIVARNRQALHFVINGVDIFVKRVKHPGSLIPPRPYLGPSVRDEQTLDGIRGILSARFQDSIAESLKASLGV